LIENVNTTRWVARINIKDLKDLIYEYERVKFIEEL
jgi:hypothetical protein